STAFRELWHPHHIVVASSDVQWRGATPPLRRANRWSATSSKTRAGGRELALPHPTLPPIGSSSRRCPPARGLPNPPPHPNSKTASALAPRDASTETEGAMPKKRLPPDAACATHHPHGSYARRWSGPRVHPHSAGADERRGSCAAERRCDLGARNIGPRKAT